MTYFTANDIDASEILDYSIVDDSEFQADTPEIQAVEEMTGISFPTMEFLIATERRNQRGLGLNPKVSRIAKAKIGPIASKHACDEIERQSRLDGYRANVEQSESAQYDSDHLRALGAGETTERIQWGAYNPNPNTAKTINRVQLASEGAGDLMTIKRGNAERWADDSDVTDSELTEYDHKTLTR